MSRFVAYKNGNYSVLFDKQTGTKIRQNEFDKLTPEFPECFDYKITDCCKHNCPECHENSKPNGIHGPIMRDKFIDTLHPYTEIAIGGGNPLEHSELEMFLHKCKDLSLICNITVHQDDFITNKAQLKEWVNDHLLYGIGVSVHNVTHELINTLKEFPNAVLHVIAGLVTIEQLNELAGNNFKLLILGYKTFRRGEKLFYTHTELIVDRNNELRRKLKTIITKGWFETISFDNLAIEQLHVRYLMSEKEWSEFYMGDDGQFTLFIDSVEQTFTTGSTSKDRYPIMDNIKDMFIKVRQLNQVD